MVKKKSKILLILSVLSVLAFLIFSIFIISHTFDSLDMQILLRFQKVQLQPIFLYYFSVLSVLGTAEITSIIWFIMLIYFYRKRKYTLCLSLLLFPIVILIEIISKNFIYHLPPPSNLVKTIHFFNIPSEYVPFYNSYPSGHVLRTTFLTLFLVFYNWRTQNKFIIFILLFILLSMIVSRIYLAEHYFSDTVGGFLLGFFAVLLSSLKMDSGEK